MGYANGGIVILNYDERELECQSKLKVSVFICIRFFWLMAINMLDTDSDLGNGCNDDACQKSVALKKSA